jgi:hypothetical protein
MIELEPRGFKYIVSGLVLVCLCLSDAGVCQRHPPQCGRSRSQASLGVNGVAILQPVVWTCTPLCDSHTSPAGGPADPLSRDRHPDRESGTSRTVRAIPLGARLHHFAYHALLHDMIPDRNQLTSSQPRLGGVRSVD